MIPPILLGKLTGALDLFSLILLALLCILIGTGLTGAALAARAFWTNVADQLDIVLLAHSWKKRLLMGLINGPIIFIIAANIGQYPPLRLLGLAMLFTLFIVTFLGLIAEMALIGRRVLALQSWQSSLFAQTIAGGILITTIFLLPFAGQAIFLLLLFRSLGTGIYWFFTRSRLPARKAEAAD
jgi:hypothetical protein